MYHLRLHHGFRALLLLIVLQITFTAKSEAQVGCPGCAVSLPVLPADTIFISDAPDGEAGQYYNADISFRMPKTTTPVNATDPSTPAGLSISSISIVAVVNVPAGLNWQPSQVTFNPSSQTDGCVKFCGTPLQPGLYEVEVYVTATVLTLNQSTSFSFPIYIAPATSTSDGFTMLNNSGCGDVTVSFENTLPSAGNDGYSYLWDFGNGTTSTLENPPAVTYSSPGTFEVNYQAAIDTFGFKVTTVRVLEAGCSDIAINTAPDLYVKIKDPQGNFVTITGVQDNVSFPAFFNINLPLGDGNYELEVRDEDTFGSQSCGYINFSKTNAGILSSGDLKVQIDVIHPVTTVQSSGTVTVYEQPPAPIVTPNGTIQLCAGEEVELVADYDQNIQWHQDTLVLFGEIFQQLNVANEGLFWLEYTSPEGCKAQSDVVAITIAPLPNAPVFQVTGNEYSLADPSQIPTNYSLQWYMDGNLLTDETNQTYCLMQPGVFLMALEVTDNDTGCSNQYSLGVSFNPAYSCASGSNEIAPTSASLLLFPNPTVDHLMVDFDVENDGKVDFQIFDAFGKKVEEFAGVIAGLHVQQKVDLSSLPAGFYLLKIQTKDGFMIGRMLKQ